jgi:hypothetical protein
MRSNQKPASITIIVTVTSSFTSPPSTISPSPNTTLFLFIIL